MKRSKIPLEEDLAILGRAVRRYRWSEDQKDLAIVVLSQRLILERAKRCRLRYDQNGRNMMFPIVDIIAKICTDDGTARFYEKKISREFSLAKHWPAYIQAGLIP